MRFIKKSENKDIQTESCGLLTEVLVDKSLPLSITTAKNIKPTLRHYHKLLVEVYWVFKGSITVNIGDSNKASIVVMNEGDTLYIDKNEWHQIIEVSAENELVVLNNPGWIPGDEYLE